MGEERPESKEEIVQVKKSFDRDNIRELEGTTVWVNTGCGKIYITLNYYNGDLIEVFLRLGRSGGCASAFLEAIGRLISTALQAGFDLDIIVKQLSGIKCPRVVHDSMFKCKVESCIDAISLVLSSLDEATRRVKENGEILSSRCEHCGSEDIEYEGRCYHCLNCNFSTC